MLIFNGVDYGDNWGAYNEAINAHKAHQEHTTGKEWREVRNPDGTVNVEQTNAANQGASAGPVNSPAVQGTVFQSLVPGKIYTNPTHGHPYLWDGSKFRQVVNDPAHLQAAFNSGLVAGSAPTGWGPEWMGAEIGAGEIQQLAAQKQAASKPPAPAAAPQQTQLPPPIKDAQTGEVFYVDPATMTWQRAANPAQYPNAQVVPYASPSLIGAKAQGQQITSGAGVVLQQGSAPGSLPVGSVVPNQASPTSPGYQQGQAGTTINQGAFSGMSADQFKQYIAAQLGVGTVPEGATLPGLAAKLGPILGGLPSGVGFNFHQLLFQDAWKAAENAVLVADRSGYLDGKPTLERQQIEADIANKTFLAEIQRDLADDAILQTRLDDAYRWAELSEQTRQFNVGQSGVLDGQLTLAGREQAAREAEIRANPRMSAAASFLPDNRGSLAGMAPGNQLPAPMSFGTPFPITTPVQRPADWQQYDAYVARKQQAAATGAMTTADYMAPPSGWTPMQQPAQPQQTAHTFLPLGTPGADDHVGTIEGGNGTRLHLYASPRGDANIPIAAATSALFSGREFSATGALPTAGGYASQASIASTLDPKKIAGRQWDLLDQDEKDRTLSVLGAGGRSEANVMHSIEAGRPRAAANVRRGHVFI